MVVHIQPQPKKKTYKYGWSFSWDVMLVCHIWHLSLVLGIFSEGPGTYAFWHIHGIVILYYHLDICINH